MKIRAAAFAALAIALGVAPPAARGEESVLAIPLRAPAPGWYTPQLHERLLEAGAEGIPVPAGAGRMPLPGIMVPVSSAASTGIRPGQLLIVGGAAGGSLCSANFVFSDPAPAPGAPRHYVGTAGHCGEVGNDFALVSIDPALDSWVSPSVAHWGGPTGSFAGAGPAPVHHTGWGLGVGAGGTPRTGVGLSWTEREWRLESAVAPGDSGSAAIVTGGLAAGSITHVLVDPRRAPHVFIAGTAMPRILELASPYRLATCSPIPWPLPGCPPL